MTFTVSPTAAIKVHQGDSGSLTIRRWLDKAKTNPEDLAGLTFELRVAKSFTSPAILVLTSNNGITVTGNEIRIDFLVSHTKPMRPGIYVYQLDMTTSPEQNDTIIDSTFTVLAEVK